MTTVAEHVHTDTAGLAWQAEADARWQASTAEVPYDPVPLPGFGRDAPEHITGPVLGWYLYDPFADVVHHVRGAHPDCGIQAINPRQFIHFWHEVERSYPDATICGLCDWSPA